MRTTILLASLALLLVCVSSAQAAGDANVTQDARTRFHRGVQLYNEGSFEAALAEFNKAYQLSPNYRLLYNIAQTQFDLHDYVAASKSLEQYVREGGSEISAERRAQVGELNRKLEDRIGQVEVTCNVDGTEIRIDDIPAGVTPLRAAVPVNAGPRRITAMKTGYTTVVRVVTVPGMEKKRIYLEIAPTKEVAVGTADPAAPGREDADIVAQREPSKKKPSRIGLITSSSLAGACAVATGVFGILALQAKNDFDRELKTVPNSKSRVDAARSNMKTYALATDIFAAATVLSVGAAVVFLFTEGNESSAPRTSLPKRSLALSPTIGGVVLHGAW